jgi:hypothetical protein
LENGKPKPGPIEYVDEIQNRRVVTVGGSTVGSKKILGAKLRCYAAALMALICFAGVNSVEAQEAYSFLAEHNGSVVKVNFGAVSEDASTLMIYYLRPRLGLEGKGVKPGTLLFDGGVSLEDGLIGGNARVFKAGCEPLKYEVRGSYNNHDKLKDFILLGPSPIFDIRGCSFNRYSSGNSARLVFKRISDGRR